MTVRRLVTLANLTMKTNSKLIGIFAVLLVVGFLLPGVSSAKNVRNWFNSPPKSNNQNQGQEQEKNSTKSYDQNENKQAQFCKTIEKWAGKVDQNIIDRQSKIQERQTERLQKLEEKRENRDGKLEQYREKWEEKWGEHFAKLEEKATTSAQGEALVEFKEAVKNAIAIRQAAVDAAISEYRTNLDKMIADRKTALEQAKTEYKNAYQIAVQKAKTDCANGVNPAQIKETLRASLMAAKDEYNSERKELEKGDVKSLVDVRQAAFKQALENFKKAMQEARDALKAALGL